MKDKKVLVADRSEICNKLTGYYLKHLGVPQENITLVNNGNKALELVQKELFDIIILSPNSLGIDVVELAKQIKTQHKENPPKIIEYTSGKIEPQHEEVFDTVIFKPTTEKIFAEKLLEALNMSEAV